jgi:hypothetical protein
VTSVGEFSPNGRIFAQWAIVYFRHFNENHKSSPNFCATFSRSVDYALILSKIGLGYILGVFSQTHLVTLPGTNVMISEIFLQIKLE